VKKTGKLLEKLSGILSAERKAQVKKYTSLKKLLKSLRSEKDRLEQKLESTSDEEAREAIQSRLQVISMQRRKGLDVLKELKQERKKKKK
jgi:hypothetical protein